MHNTPPSKDEVILKLLSEGDTMLCLDARHSGVRVPPQQAQNPALRLILNLNFPHPLNVTAEGVSANLSFSGRRFPCYIPLEAIWAAFNPQTMEGMVWPESASPEILADLVAQQQQIQSQPAAPAATEQATDDPRAPEAAAVATPRQRGHLRLVK